MRAARNGGRFWDHEAPEPEEINDKQWPLNSNTPHDVDMESEHHGRSDSLAELKGYAARPSQAKGGVSIGMQAIYTRD